VHERRRLVATVLVCALVASFAFATARPVTVFAETPTATAGPAADGSATPDASASAGATGTFDATASVASSDTSGVVAASSAASGSVGVTVTVSPDTERSVAPGFGIGYALTITNETTASGQFDLKATDTADFDTVFSSREETSIVAVQLAAGETTEVVATISVPSDADTGVVDVSTLSATLDTSASVSAAAVAVIRVRSGLEFTPDRTGFASPATQVTYRHSVVNSRPTTRTVELSYADSSGWPVAFFESDGVTEISSVTVGPFGDSREIVAKLSVPTTASTPATDTLTITATDASDTAEVVDTTAVRTLGTYADSACTTPSSSFRLTDVVYARATALEPSATVCFVWTDPDGAIGQSATATVDASGTVFDQYSTQTSDTVGAWTVELHSDSATGTVIDFHPFTLTFDGRISALSASDGRNVDATIVVAASVDNLVSREITSSTMSYLIWWDGNGNGSYDAGDIAIDASGAPQPYSAEATTHVTAIESVPASGTWTEPAPWSVTNARFPEQGTYSVTATWRDANGTVIDVKTAQFWAIPALGWPLLIVLVATMGVVMWRGRGGPPEEPGERGGRRWRAHSLLRSDVSGQRSCVEPNA
jgi:hypothetical protein